MSVRKRPARTRWSWKNTRWAACAAPSFEGDTVSGSLMAGQVAGMLHEVRPVADILADLWNGGRQRIAALNEEC